MKNYAQMKRRFHFITHDDKVSDDKVRDNVIPKNDKTQITHDVICDLLFKILIMKHELKFALDLPLLFALSNQLAF